MVKSKKENVDQNIKRRRSTIWQLDPSLHCSIIGTCLSTSQLQQMVKKKIYDLSEDFTDYEIHQALVMSVTERNDQSRALNKLFDLKYRLIIRRYAFLSSATDVYREWVQDVKGNEVAGAYWAALTHPAMDAELATMIYGECHMLSFDSFSRRSKNRRKVSQLAQKIGELERCIEKERNIRIRHERQIAASEQEKKLIMSEEKRREQELRILRQENISIKKLNASAGIDVSRQVPESAEQKRDEERSMNLISSLKKQLKNAAKKIDTLRDQNLKYRAQLTQLSNRLAHQKKGPPILESALLSCACDDKGCNQCNDKGSNNCPGPDLCGKTVLYVGGQHKMIPRYKELVEKHGGVFLHHDGGKETSHHVLATLLKRADAVFCPIDCISHEACKRVKKTCKRSSKPFVMMRSSGVSSLAKGLQSMIQ